MFVVDNTKIPLHPGTHLIDMPAMMRLRDKWVNSSPNERLAIISNIFLEMENFGDCYRMLDVSIDDSAFIDDSVDG